MELLALMIYILIVQLCSLFNEYCKVIEKLIIVLLVI